MSYLACFGFVAFPVLIKMFQLVVVLLKAEGEKVMEGSIRRAGLH